MVKDNTYYFHQTPEELAKKLILEVELKEGDKVLEPFKGEGSFYNNFPNNIEKFYTEIEEGKDFREFKEEVDWVISNPPFRLQNGAKRENAFFQIVKHFSTQVRKGMAFLGNDYCLSTLTPKRLKELNQQGLYINKIFVCNVKAWRGRYFFIIFKKTNPNFYSYIEGSF
jgi:hypothetical protein